MVVVTVLFFMEVPLQPKCFQLRDSSLESTKSLGIPLHPVSHIEIAEISKIAENAHRYLQIAFAEDLYLYSQANGINFAELRELLNTKWNVNILEPRDGIGGHCLPKDTKMFLESSHSQNKSKILSAAIEVDHTYREYRQAKNIAPKQRSEQSDILDLTDGSVKDTYWASIRESEGKICSHFSLF